MSVDDAVIIWSLIVLAWLGWLTVREFRGRPVVTTTEATQDDDLERYHDHAAALASALDDAVFDACKQAGVPACYGRDGPHGDRCSIGTVHTRTAQVAQLLADMVRDMGAGAEQAAKMVQLLGDALGEGARPVMASMGAIVPAYLVGATAPAIDHGLHVHPEEPEVSDEDKAQAAVDRYATIIDHEFTFSPTEEERRRAMELLNLRHTGKCTVPLDVECSPEHVASHHACAMTRKLLIAMGLRHDGNWEVASPASVLLIERGRAEARARAHAERWQPDEPSGKSGELTVVLTGPPLADIQPGLYELEFEDGTRSLAAVGRDPHDRPWWAACSIKERSWLVWNWSEVRGATLVRAATT